MKRTHYKNIDHYISTFPKDIQVILKKMRTSISKAAPDATEAISYQIPTYKFHGNLVHFAAFAKHASLFPGSAGVRAFEKKLKAYKHSKGTIQFPLDKKIPYALISQIVKFRVKQNTPKDKGKFSTA